MCETAPSNAPRIEVPGRTRIMVCGGGSGTRTITLALARSGAHVARIVPAWDSGGSSRAIRASLDMLPVGDIRQALMTLAHGEGRVGHVVRIFNTRLPDGVDAATLRQSFDYHTDGKHPLMQSLDAGLRGAITNYLDVFKRAVGRDFDLRNGSIGNFILTGAYLAHNRDINTAIFVFRKLCSIEGDVWPVSRNDDVAMTARLADGSIVDGQDRIANLPPAQAAIGIADVTLRRTGGDAKAGVQLNPAVRESIERADAIVIGPGSFFTSILPHFKIDDFSAAVAARTDVPKIVVGNMLECSETLGLSVAAMVERLTALSAHGVRVTRPLVTHVLANRPLLPFAPAPGKAGYVQPGTPAGRDMDWTDADIEDPWQRGAHDAGRVATFVLDLAARSRHGTSTGSARNGN